MLKVTTVLFHKISMPVLSHPEILPNTSGGEWSIMCKHVFNSIDIFIQSMYCVQKLLKIWYSICMVSMPVLEINF